MADTGEYDQLGGCHVSRLLYKFYGHGMLGHAHSQTWILFLAEAFRIPYPVGAYVLHGFGTVQINFVSRTDRMSILQE